MIFVCRVAHHLKCTRPLSRLSAGLGMGALPRRAVFSARPLSRFLH